MDDEEKQLILDLPTNFVSVSKPSPTIVKMLEKKKEEHELLITSMKEEIIKINKSIDEEIKDKSAKMTEVIYRIREEMKQYYINVKFGLKNFEIEDDYYKKGKRNLARSNQKQLDAINDFCTALRDMEESRSNKFKILLKNTKQKAIEIGHELPFMLDEFFELQIMEMNKITLSNYQHYADVEKELKLQIINDFKEWFEELIEVKEAIKDRVKALVKKSIMIHSESIKPDFPDDFEGEMKRFNSLKSYFYYQVEGEDDASLTSNIEKWLKGIQRTLAALDMSAKNIVKLYKSTIPVLFHRYFGELKEIKKVMLHSIVHSNQVDEYVCEMYTPSIEEMSFKEQDEFQRIQGFWEDSIQEMTEHINTTYSFVKGATHLWDRHFIRIKELQTLVLRDLENLIKKHGFSSDCYDANLNIILEKLRQGSQKHELDKYLSGASEILSKMEQMYNQNAKAEIAVVTKYKVMMETGIEVLQTELRRYLTIHPPDADRDPKKQRKRASQMSVITQDPYKLPIQALYVVFQVGAVKNWMFGLWEAIDQYINTCKQEIITQIDGWIATQTEYIMRRFHLKIALHGPRYEHIKCFVYEKRLKEIKLHSKILEDHKSATSKKIEDLHQRQKFYELECLSLCDKYNEECEKILECLPKTKNKTEAKTYRILMREKLTPIEKELTSLTENYIKSCKIFLEELKYHNYEFLSNAKLFSEGGNFSSNELTDLCNELLELELTSGEVIEELIKDIDYKSSSYSSVIQSYETNLTDTMNTTINEHNHNDTIVYKIKALHLKTQEHVEQLKYSFSNIQWKLQWLKDDFQKNLGNISYLDEILKHFDKLLGEVLELDKYMSHDEPICLFVHIYNHAVATSSRKSEHMDNLFKIEPSHENDNFLSILLMMVRNSFADITNYAYKFYNLSKTGMNHILDATKLQPTFEDCIDEVLRKYKSYAMQCEISWLKNAEIFLEILKSLEDFKNQIHTKFQDSYYDICLNKVKKQSEDIMEELKKDEEEFNNNLKQIYKRLKVLFGHPKNIEMLKQLQQDYDNIHADQEAQFKKILSPRKKAIDEAMDKIRINLQEVTDKLSVIKSNTDIVTAIMKLNDQIMAKRKLILDIVNSDHQEKPINENVLEHITKYLQQSSDDLGCSDYQLDVEILPSEINLQNRSDFTGLLEFTLNVTKGNMDHFIQERMVKSLEDFKNIWDSEIKFILSLYKVKYSDDIL